MTSERCDFYCARRLRSFRHLLRKLGVLNNGLITGNIEDHCRSGADGHDNCRAHGVFPNIVFTSHLVSLPFDVISQARIGIAPILAPSTLPLSPDHPTGAAARIHERRATLRTPEPHHRSSARPATPGSGSRLLRARVGIRRQWRTDTVWPRRAIESVL